MADAPFEKTGNANWAQCPACDHWFHVATSLLSMPDVDLICPDCGKNFPPAEAAAVIRN